MALGKPRQVWQAGNPFLLNNRDDRPGYTIRRVDFS